MSHIAEALARARGGASQPQSERDPGGWGFATPDAGNVEVPENFRPEPKPVATTPARIKQSAPAIASAASARGFVVPTPQLPTGAPRVNSAYAQKLISAEGLPGGVVEQYRRLGVALHQAQLEKGIRVVMVASAVPGEGKSLVASNVALVLSRSYGRRVLLMDADMRKPSLHHIFGVENEHGLGDCVAAADRAAIPVVPVAPTLDLLTAGKPAGDPVEILTGEAMRSLIHDGTVGYDWVIVDTPPVTLIADAHLLAMMAHRLLLVIAAGSTPFEAVQKAIEMVGKERILGTVLNRADGNTSNPYQGQYSDYYGL